MRSFPQGNCEMLTKRVFGLCLRNEFHETCFLPLCTKRVFGHCLRNVLKKRVLNGDYAFFVTCFLWLVKKFLMVSRLFWYENLKWTVMWFDETRKSKKLEPEVLALGHKWFCEPLCWLPPHSHWDGCQKYVSWIPPMVQVPNTFGLIFVIFEFHEYHVSY